jgi:hypothetical protein
LRLTVARDLGKRPAAQRFLAFADTEVFSWAPSCLVGRLSRVGSNRNPAWSLRSLISFLDLHPVGRRNAISLAQVVIRPSFHYTPLH